MGDVATAQEAPAHLLPVGSPLTFICDETVTLATVRPGSTFRIHLRDGLYLDGEALAPAGAAARLIVLERVSPPAGSTPEARIALAGFSVRSQELPVAPLRPVVGALSVGTEIAAKTQGSVALRGTSVEISVPLPFSLSGDPPNSAFSPVPARTAPPRALDRRAPSPRSTASAAVSPTPIPTST